MQNVIYFTKVLEGKCVLIMGKNGWKKLLVETSCYNPIFPEEMENLQHVNYKISRSKQFIFCDTSEAKKVLLRTWSRKKESLKWYLLVCCFLWVDMYVRRELPWKTSMLKRRVRRDDNTKELHYGMHTWVWSAEVKCFFLV